MLRRKDYLCLALLCINLNLKNIFVSDDSEKISGLSLSQPFLLDSACGTPKYTNYTVGFADCLDYIFYQTNTLKVKEVS